ncbi:MAG: winged helix-turn-helix transcriptional regulator [Rhodospirillales bacterium]|nr:winged helix-turn-helix transcriptional regulator [Rhodospirillales bacterium]
MVHDNSATSQRSMAGDLGIALGLANAYLKRCVKKGLIKVSQAPANRYAYYLTPNGFAEKSRLTAEFLSESFNLFRRARSESAELFNQCQNHNWKRIALYGTGDLTEIMALSAKDFPIEVACVISRDPGVSEFAGIPVVTQTPNPNDIDAIVICAINGSQTAYDNACANFPPEKVLVFGFLSISKAAKPKERGVK